MKIFDALFRREKPKRQQSPGHRRRFTGAATDRLFEGWTVSNQSADAELFLALRILRARSRDLAINDDYVKKFLQLLRTNVIGPHGIALQNRARDPDGSLDTMANDLIESGWKNWGQLGNCTVDGRMSWIDAQNLWIETLGRDGECLVRMWKNPKLNPWGFALQFIDVDQLDETYNDNLPNGNEIRLGIEYDAADRPQTYFVLSEHPNGLTYGQKPMRRMPIPAAEIIHSYVPHRSAQGRGYPWTAQSLRRLKMLSGYEFAELVAARTAAGKMGFFTEASGDDYTGDDVEEWEPITEAEAGTFDRLPTGVDFKSWDPQHPNTGFDAFLAAILRGATAGLGPSYVSISGDLRGVSYSSIRQGSLDERDFYRTLQTFAIEHFAQIINSRWLQMSLTTQAVPLPLGKFAKFCMPIWRPRGWSWVDPLKEVNAAEKSVRNRFRSLQHVIGEAGYDIEDILADNKVAKELAEKYGDILTILQAAKGGVA